VARFAATDAGREAARDKTATTRRGFLRWVGRASAVLIGGTTVATLSASEVAAEAPKGCCIDACDDGDDMKIEVKWKKLTVPDGMCPFPRRRDCLVFTFFEVPDKRACKELKELINDVFERIPVDQPHTTQQT
jgi:hypothetical protein